MCRTKSKIQIETSELENEIKQLEKIIIEQERQEAAKEAARKAYENSFLEAKKRTETAKEVYKSLTSPISTSSTSTANRISGNPNAQSFLPETFLQDLKLSFLDTRGAAKEEITQLQSGLPTNDEISAASAESYSGDKVTNISDTLASTEKDTNNTALERVQKLGVEEWNKLIYANALEGNSKNAEKIIQLMEEVGVQPNIESFSHLTEAYSNSDDLNRAIETLDIMLSTGLIPPISAYNSIIKIHSRKRDIKSAFQVFESLKKHHNPDTEVFTSLIKGCLRSEEYDLGWKVFNQMQLSGATPIESTYSVMIQACAKTDQVEKALDIFRSYPTRGLQPTDVTFNSLIHACAMRREYFSTAFALLNEMQNVYGFSPDISTYNTLLFACSKRKDLLTARRVLQKVIQLDSEGALKLDGITVTNFLWCVTEWKSMDVHLNNMKLRSRNSNQSHVDQDLSTTELRKNSSTDLSVLPSYFILPSKPPKNEQEALSEGESVFTWFLSRSAEEFPYSDKELESEGQLDDTDLDQHDALKSSDTNSITSALPVLSIPRASRKSQIRTRLLNAYLSMYVRHQDIRKASEIYRGYFDHFKRKRDSWTYSTMLEGCYNWKDVDLGAEVFRDWRSWRKSTGKLTEKRTRQADYNCYRRMINLLARTNHLDESIALLEELSIAATPPNTRLRAGIASAEASLAQPTAPDLSSSPTLTANTSDIVQSSTALKEVDTGSLLFLQSLQDSTLPIYPQLKDFPIVYTKTWELEDEGARRLLLRLCHGKVDSLFPSSSQTGGEGSSSKSDDKSILPEYNDKNKSRRQKALRNTAIKWKGEHPQEKGFYVGKRRIKELDRDLSKRGQDHHRK
ncbi:hypothetical protein BGZ76_007712 [Entomortierella beljakovae]|nr:hypothetical protein BGZ76_007712 [Entomortierella beljakovae]